MLLCMLVKNCKMQYQRQWAVLQETHVFDSVRFLRPLRQWSVCPRFWRNDAACATLLSRTAFSVVISACTCIAINHFTCVTCAYIQRVSKNCAVSSFHQVCVKIFWTRERVTKGHQRSCFLVRPPVWSNGRSYKMLVMFLFFAAKSPSSLGRSPRNFATWSEPVSIL